MAKPYLSHFTRAIHDTSPRAGEVIDNAEMQRRMEEQRLLGQHHFYIMELGPGLFIDAHKRGNFARLLNSSCEPNCETQKWWVAAVNGSCVYVCWGWGGRLLNSSCEPNCETQKW